MLSFHVQATTHYRFEVCAWTAKGAGPWRVATIQSGVEPVLPSPPTKLAVTNIEAFSVVLQFTPGFDGNSSITKWIVEVSIFIKIKKIIKLNVLLQIYQFLIQILRSDIL